MSQAMKLEGYLMKEKSKLTLLHGLTGDVNKRYFRIRSIEGSEELALCYYKNINDPEVRGWVYLKDVTEIAEHQDTIILTTVARTLHLYAETRAQHNQWVTGLAKLCPDAFAMIGRNSSVGTTLDGVPPGGSRTPPATTKTAETSLKKDRHESPMNVPAAGVSITAEMSLTVDEDSGHSTVEDHGRAECFRTPREHDKMSRRQNRQHQDQSSGAQRELGERRASCHAADGNGQKSCGRVGLARNKVDTKDGHHARRSSDGDRRPQRPKSGFTRCDETSHKERVRSRKEKLGRRSEGSEYQREINVNIVDECDPGSAGSPTIRCSNTGDTDDEADRCSPINSESSGRQRLEASGTRNNATGKDEEKEEIERQSELHPTKLASDDIASDTTVEQERGIGTSGNAGVVVQGEAHRDEFTKRSRIFSSDNENVETIELSEGTRHNSVTQDHAKDGEQQQAGDHSPAGVRKGSNQDEDKEFDEDAEIDREVPQLEIENWGNPPPGQSATSRLHRHISQSSVEAGNLKVSVPPPKEFLTQGSLKPSVSEQHDMGRANANAGRHRDTEQTRSFDVPKPASNGRRRTAADLEWSDGAETPDRPRCVEENLTQPVTREPVDLGDSDEEGKDDLDLEVEKQRRRATAALVALEAAAKEADEGAQMESEALAKQKRKNKGGARGVVAKAYPSPAAPPPPALLRKARRAQGVPPPGVAPPKAVRPPRVKATNHRAVPDDNFVRDDWDDEIKTPCHGSPVSRGRAMGGLPVASVDAARNQASNWTQFDD